MSCEKGEDSLTDYLGRLWEGENLECKERVFNQLSDFEQKVLVILATPYLLDWQGPRSLSSGTVVEILGKLEIDSTKGEVNDARKNIYEALGIKAGF